MDYQFEAERLIVFVLSPLSFVGARTVAEEASHLNDISESSQHTDGQAHRMSQTLAPPHTGCHLPPYHRKVRRASELSDIDRVQGLTAAVA
jgi:hypothetical protein